MSTIKTWDELETHLAESVTGSDRVYLADDVDKILQSHAEAFKVAQEANETLRYEIDSIPTIKAKRDALQEQFDLAVVLWKKNEDLQEEIIAELQAKLNAIEAQGPVGVVGCDDYAALVCVGTVAYLEHPLPTGTKLYAAPVATAKPVNELVRKLLAYVCSVPDDGRYAGELYQERNSLIEEACTALPKPARPVLLVNPTNSTKYADIIGMYKAAQPITKEQVEQVEKVLVILKSLEDDSWSSPSWARAKAGEAIEIMKALK